MRKNRFIFLLAFFTSAAASPKLLLGCANDYVPNTKAIKASQALVQDLLTVELIEPWSTRRDRLRKEVENGGDYKTRNDLATALMHTGDAETAIQILKEIERTNPGLYQTASNLGTAFELAGDNARALDWIRIGIQRNPDSHHGSEWLHVKILEAKIGEQEFSAASKPNWTNTGSLLGLVFENGVPTNLPLGNDGKPLTLAQVEDGLKYQLHERLQFVKPQNQIVASLLFDLGSVIEHRAEGPGMAQAIYELAAQYAETRTPAQEEVRLTILGRASRAANANRTFSLFANPILTFGFLAIGSAIAVYIVDRIRSRRRSK